jgi:hypothetical protein
MLRPTKHSHPDKTTINVALLLLRKLMVCRVDDFQALLQYSKKEVVGGDYLFLPALNLLYLLGLIEYRPKTDAIEYVGPHGTVQALL